MLSIIRLAPHWIFFNFHKNKNVIKYDISRWQQILGEKKNIQLGFLKLMTFHPAFRNLFYFRIGYLSHLLNILCPRMSTLFIHTKTIGPGLFIQHGFATTIGAKSLGKDCWINQQVTIGFSNSTDQPIIQDNVVINAGAKVIGNVIIGENSKVGANAVVVKNVPANCTVVGVPAFIVKRNGLKVKEFL